MYGILSETGMTDDGREQTAMSGTIPLPGQHTYSRTTRQLITGALLVVFLVSVTALPNYNKYVLNRYDYALSYTWISMVLVAIILLLVNIIDHLWRRRVYNVRSWVFGPGFIRKVRLIAPPAVFFAINISMANAGLLSVTATLHVLLRASQFVWVVIFSYMFVGEKPTIPISIACLCLIAGVVLEGANFHSVDFPSAWSFTLNLGSAFASGLQIVTLRRACLKLRTPFGLNMSVMEITLFKMVMATLIVLPFVVIFERDGFDDLGELPYPDSTIIMWFAAGTGITLTYQAAVVGLTAYTRATTVALVSQLKIVAQVFLSIVVIKDFSYAVLDIIGTFLIVLSSIAYGTLRWYDERQKRAAEQHQKTAKTLSNLSNISDDNGRAYHAINN